MISKTVSGIYVYTYTSVVNQNKFYEPNSAYYILRIHITQEKKYYDFLLGYEKAMIMVLTFSNHVTFHSWYS